MAAAAPSTFALLKDANEILHTFSALSSNLFRTLFTVPCDFSENGCDERHTLRGGLGVGRKWNFDRLYTFYADLDKIR